MLFFASLDQWDPAFEAEHDEPVFPVRYMTRFAQQPEMLGR
jgi:hypothetical protein